MNWALVISELRREAKLRSPTSDIRTALEIMASALEAGSNDKPYVATFTEQPLKHNQNG